MPVRFPDSRVIDPIVTVSHEPCASLSAMSRDSAAVFDDHMNLLSDPVPDLHSLYEGIAILGRFEEILAELESALDAMPLTTP